MLLNTVIALFGNEEGYHIYASGPQVLHMYGSREFLGGTRRDTDNRSLSVVGLATRAEFAWVMLECPVTKSYLDGRRKDTRML